MALQARGHTAVMTTLARQADGATVGDSFRMRSVITPLLVISSATLRTNRKPHAQERNRARTSSSEWLHVRNTKYPCATGAMEASKTERGE